MIVRDRAVPVWRFDVSVVPDRALTEAIAVYARTNGQGLATVAIVVDDMYMPVWDALERLSDQVRFEWRVS